MQHWEFSMKHITIHKNFGLWPVVPLFLFACYGALAAFPDLRKAVPEMLIVTAIITILLAATALTGEKSGRRCPLFSILIIAAGLRLLFLFHTPQLSDDVYRYLFDGSQILNKHNPYGIVPKDIAQGNTPMAILAEKVNHPQLTTIYPPAAQMLFAVGTFLGGMTGLKLLFIIMDLVLITFMTRLASALKMSPWRIILYAWHPLPILEIASSGHLDGAGLMTLLAAISILWFGKNISNQKLAVQNPWVEWLRSISAGFLYSFSVMVKLFPIVFLPLAFFLIPKKQRLVFLGGLSLGCALLIFPFYPAVFSSFTTLHIYATTWEFSGLAFQALREIGLNGFTARLVLASVFFSLLLYGYLKPRHQKNDIPCHYGMLAKIISSHYLIGFGFLFLTPTLHPWYGLYMIVFLPFSPNAAGIILSWSIFLGYNVLIPYVILHQWVENDLVPYLIWLGPVMAMVVMGPFRRYFLIFGTQPRWSR